LQAGYTERWSRRFYDLDNLLYTKINGKWGFAIETLAGHAEADEHRVHETWPFNEAPRGKRVKAVKFIPELLDKLAKDAAAMVADVDEQSDAVAEITAAISAKSPVVSAFQQKLKEALNPPVNYDEIAITTGGEPASSVVPQDVIVPVGTVTIRPRPVGGKSK
jgi:hypothetical protein